MKDIIKGLLIGIGKIIPGVSGSVIAISLGVYEKAIYSLNNLFKDKKHIYYLAKLCIGVVLSIIFISKIIVYLLNNYYAITIFAFVGFILGSMKEITNNIKCNYFYLTVLAFIFIVVLSFVDVANSFHSSNIVITYLYYFLAGIIDALSTIIPGLSGTALLMLMGVYNNIMLLFSNLLNFNIIISNLEMVIPFFVGMATGLFIALKLISFLFEKYYYQTYNVILGLLLGSIVVMLKGCIYNFSTLVLAICVILLSLILVKKINHFFD